MHRYGPATAMTVATAILLATGGSAAAQDCTRPTAWSEPRLYGSLSKWLGSAGTICSLYSQYTTTTEPYAVGVISYTYPPETRQARLRFDLDFSLVDLSTGLHRTGLVSWAGTQWPSSNPARLVQIHLRGPATPSGPPLLRFIYADPTNLLGNYGLREISIGSGTTVSLTVELHGGAEGYLHYWLGSDFNAAPTGRIPASGYLDWSAYGDIGGISLGVFSGTTQYRDANLAKDLIFSGLVVDDRLFRSTFE